ncbi:STY4851/ECs_5259 family protein [Vreelandella aquamarina]|jgi:hypothetical protein|uniref:STY4851/ECs_5259 family protein n=1 Tax=Vreelandella aquamarina TaxID=77097 RepID=UPI000A6D8A1F|nr:MULTISPECIES: STY4851/ECs_5259 family protein [Halomonas]MCD1650240.1 STY4851/ECs_5259 family protein [Halomonas axialensis]MCD2086905.1 STY4851/ECs_5259 family protein [Halomonas meridiana]|tara:strand:- start:1927 stop:5226 length:3300 start_codon:yes stop_codon:yes gene_type:complete
MDHLKGWIFSYLNKRGLSAPTGSPLYSYATTDNEYQFLSAALAANAEERHDPIFRIYWAAGFCIFVSEKYRREYESHWSWQAFDAELEIQGQPNDRAELVRLGLKFWERPLRYREQRADYLGSLFAEGGLPWRLLQNEQHGFGRAIKAGLNYRNAGQETVAVIRQYEAFFPQSFRNDQTYQLMVSTVSTLKRLASEYELDQQSDPAAFLNQYAPGWREHFPLPLEEDNGVALVNEWLVDASVQVKKRQQARDSAQAFTCEHWLSGSLASPRLEAQVWLKKSLQIEIEGHSITNSRVELALYEGERLALKLGVDYGQIEGHLMTVRLPVETATVSRQQPNQPLLLVVSCAGKRLDTRVIQSSETDWQLLPAVFVEHDEVTRLVGVASVQYLAAEALLRVPPGMQAPYADVLQIDDLGGHWYRISGTCVLEQDSARYVIEPGKDANKTRVVWQGSMSSRSTLPVASWRGWPRCQLLDTHDQAQEPAGFRVNGRQVTTLEALPSAGSFKVEVLGEGQRVVARRTLGILPRDLAISALPASSKAPARLIIRSTTALEVRVLNPELGFSVEHEGLDNRVYIEPNRQAPAFVQLDIRDLRSPQGVVVRLPYPEEGAQLLKANGEPLTSTGLTLRDVLGTTLALTPPPDVARTFCVTIELMGQTIRLERQYHYRVKNSTSEVSLYSLYDDMLALLSGSAEQDATLRCRVETSQLHKQFYIYPYQAVIQFTNKYCEFFELVDHSNNPLMYRCEGTTVMAMHLANPESAPVAILPSATNGVVTGFYELPEALYKDGPWLLYPAENASIIFRPAIHVPDPDICQASEETEIKTLHAAARYYHPQHYPQAFDGVLDAMAEDFFHSGWSYMAELKANYAHLPLSSLESWKHLARHPEAMALAVFRLEITPDVAQRLAHELAVIWEVITVAQWQAAVQCYINALAKEFGLPASLLGERVSDRMALLSVQVPVFRNFAEMLCQPSQPLTTAPPLQVILPGWLNVLRAQHDQDEWPTHLGRSLSQWLQQQEHLTWLVDWLAERELPEHTYAVILIPIFAAHLTAGSVALNALPAEDAERRFAFRVLSDFDRTLWYEPVYSACLSNILNAVENDK